MNRLQAHRGPDDEGCHIDARAGVGLGHRRLSIIGLESGHQPMSGTSGAVLVFNGEIYLGAIHRRRDHAAEVVALAGAAEEEQEGPESSHARPPIAGSAATKTIPGCVPGPQGSRRSRLRPFFAKKPGSSSKLGP